MRFVGTDFVGTLVGMPLKMGSKWGILVLFSEIFSSPKA
jgi:hypothetical protein